MANLTSFQELSRATQTWVEQGTKQLWYGLQTNMRPWSFALLGTLGISAVVGTLAGAYIFNLPQGPECSVGYSSSDPASTKLLCAQKYVGEQSLEGYQSAIQLVNSIAPEDPLRSQADKLIDQWAAELLRLGEVEIQKGEFAKAVSAAEKVPARVSSYGQVTAQIERWRKSWKTAEEIYESAEKAIEQREWGNATEMARRLLSLGNQYWANTRHQQLMEAIEAARGELQAKEKGKGKADDTAKKTKDPLAEMNRKLEGEALQQLQRARELARVGDRQALKAAIREAGQVMYGTPQRKEADALIADLKQQLRGQGNGLSDSPPHISYEPEAIAVDTQSQSVHPGQAATPDRPTTLPPAELPPINELGRRSSIKEMSNPSTLPLTDPSIDTLPAPQPER